MKLTINNGTTAVPGDRVYTHDINGEKTPGTLRFGETFRGQEFFIEYDDGESFIVLAPFNVFKEDTRDETTT